MNIKKLRSSSGFTIVELMIALSILSVILVMSTVILIQIGDIYTKGINTDTLQDATRNVLADITASLEFSGSVPTSCTQPVAPDPNTNTTCDASYTDENFPGGTVRVYAYCIGETRYSYVLDTELGTDQGTSPVLTAYHVLWRDTVAPGKQTACPPVDLSGSTVNEGPDAATSDDGYDMLPPHTRLTKFWIMENPANSGIYDVEVWTAFGDTDPVHTDLSTGITTCISDQGTTQFCAISQQSSAVTLRLD